MNLEPSTLWWILAGALVLAELNSGTLYLLMLALGASAGALSAWANWGLQGQLVTAALVGGGATVVLTFWRRQRETHEPRSQADPNLMLDIGQRVDVSAWDHAGRSKVFYRGATWDARLASGSPAKVGPHRIVGVEGNELVIQPEA